MEKTQGRPKVSVVVPVFNQECYLDKCMSSICGQTYKSLEVIVVNDGSSDNSLSIAKLWADKDDRVVLIDKNNEGVSLARRDGMMAATGEFLACVDSDDWLPCDALETMMGLALDKNLDLVIGSIDKRMGVIRKRHIDKAYTFPYDQVVAQPELFDKYYLGFFRNNIFSVSMCARVYRKSVIDQAMQETGLFDAEVNMMGEDQFFNLKLFPYLQSMYRTGKTVYNYRYSGVTTRFNSHFPQLFISTDKRLAMLDKFGYSQGYPSLYAEYVACLYRFGRQLIAYHQADKEGVMAFFEQEMNTRKVVPRLLEYHKQAGTQRKDVQLMQDRDFEGMYQYSLNALKANRRSLKFRLRRGILKLMGKW